MNIDHAEYIKLQAQLQDHFDGRYRKIDDCDELVEREANKIDMLTVEFAKSNTKLNILIAILSTIAVPILSVCVKMLFGG